MSGLSSTRLGRVDLPGKSLLLGPLSFEHVLCGLPSRVQFRFSLSFYDSLQRLGVGALALRRQVLRSSFELLRRAILNKMPTYPTFLAHITGRRVSEPSYAQSYSRAVLHIMPGDAASSTNIISWWYAASFLARHGTHLGGCQSRTVRISGVVVRIDP